MGKWKALQSALGAGLRRCWALLGWMAAQLFGRISWQSPAWLRGLRGALAHAARAVATAARARPRVATLTALLVLSLAAGAYAGWRWWKSLPQPVEVTFDAPATLPRTCYECTGAAADPASLTITFSASVAPLERAGKVIDPARSGISVTHAPAGVWRWIDDRQLEFKPSADWPIDQAIDVEFARKGFAARQVRLAHDRFTTRTAPFSARVTQTEFYQDPVVAANKQGLFTVTFSHPVDATDFESRLKLELFEKISDQQERDAGAVNYTVTYDRLKLNAYVHSAPLSLPAKPSRLRLSIAKGVHAARDGNAQTAQTAQVIVPGLDSLKVQNVSLQIARDERNDPTQVLIAQLSYSVLESDLAPQVHAWLLPVKHPDAERQKHFEKQHPRQPFDWTACGCMGAGVNGYDPELIAQSEPLKLTLVPGELDHHELQSFSYSAEPGRTVYLRIDKGLKSFGGFRLGNTYEALRRVPEYPRELRVMAQGSLMAMSGPKKLNLFTRDVPAMRVDIERLLPHQLQHLVTQTDGRFSSPEFDNYRFDASNITEHVTHIEDLPALARGAPNYTTLDLAPYLKADGVEKRGIFLMRVRAWDKQHKRPLRVDNTPPPQDNDNDSDGDDSQSDGSASDGDTDSGVRDTRLIVITDLGLLVKRNLDGTQDLFVQSIHSGAPVAGVEVSVIGRNGEPVLNQASDADGHVHFADLKDFKLEKQPVLYLARKDGDSSFLPIDARAHTLDLSRFDVGGVANNVDRDALSAYLFSDRGLYRPGEEIRAGLIVRSQSWKPLQGVPLNVEISDPRGAIVSKQRIVLGAAGFDEIRHTTPESAPAGNYTINVSIDKKEGAGLIGSLVVQVRDFQPDRLKMSATLSSSSVDGWVSPDALKASVSLQNLFGTPAQQRRVTGAITLTPALMNFPAYRDYQFYDPQAAKQSYSEDLPDAKTDDSGAASFDLNLKRFEKASYELRFLAQGFEADGGRGVAVQTVQRVSAMPYLVGYKVDGDLGFIVRDGARSVELLAIDPQAHKAAVKDLKLSLRKVVYTSVLVKQNSGVYRYESRRKEVSQKESTLDIGAAGATLALPTGEPGTFVYLLTDAAGQQLSRFEFTVAGDANLSRSLEKNAELKIALSKPDYAPGEDVELQITAPYAGAGLITIERDKVYSWRWFHTDTTASTQRIRLPEGIEGNAYVSVSFVRDPGSPEIYMSPLSYGVAPFSVALDARRNAVRLTLPDKLKPGDTATFRYATDKPARIVLFAVDEGILQVARYPTPDPLGHFFQKRSLDVSTRQILDLILPEFSGAMAAAPGGDADNLLGKHLNPFKRKGDKPVAWWSGIVDADSTPRELQYTIPDYFNGTLRVFAVAVSDDTIGVFDGKTFVRGDFVLSPSAPTTVAPGDEFDVSLGVANNVDSSGANASIALKLETTAGLQVVGEASPSLAVAAGHESSVRFHLKATDTLGPADLVFSARLGDKTARRRIDLSVRPAVPYRVDLLAGRIAANQQVDVPVTRDLFAPQRELSAGVSVLPLALAHGYVAYLGHYGYSCTEQLMSMAMPGIVLSQRPEFGSLKIDPKSGLDALIDELRSRQNPDGAYRYWPGGTQVEEFVSIYAQQGLIEAADRGLNVPRELLDHGNDWLRDIAARNGDSIEQERDSAYALYLLTRQGQVMGAEAAGMRQRLQENYGDEAAHDIAWAYLASALQLMKQKDAEKLFARASLDGSHAYDRWRDPMVWDAQLLYLTARHFPQRLNQLPASLLDHLVQRTQQGQTHSLAAGTTLLALDAYASAVAATTPGAHFDLSELLRDGKTRRALKLSDALLPRVDFDAEARSLRMNNGSALPAYYVLSQAGFDRRPPDAALVKGLEILHDYTDAAGKPVTSVKMGDEVSVHLKFRAVDHAPFYDAALVDLLPGGFELVVQPQDVQQQVLQASRKAPADASADNADAQGDAAAGDAGDGDAGDAEDGDGGEQWSQWLCPICVAGTLTAPQYADFREDRTVFYVDVTPDVSEIVYRIKATNTGRFVLPPAYGEAMYEPAVQARSAPGSITVNPP